MKYWKPEHLREFNAVGNELNHWAYCKKGDISAFKPITEFEDKLVEIITAWDAPKISEKVVAQPSK